MSSRTGELTPQLSRGRSADSRNPARAGRVRHPFDVDPAVAREITENYVHRRVHGCAELDEHHDLIRYKVAGALAVLDDRLDIADEDWRLAGMVMDMSDATRATVLAVLAEADHEREYARRQRDAGREIHKHDAMHSHRVVECAKRIAHKVQAGGDWTRRDLRNALRRWRDVFDDGLEHALEQECVIESIEPGQGADKHMIRPGTKRTS